MTGRYWLETLGCPKNEVDSEKLVGTLWRDGFESAADPESADVLVVNTCAFIEAARLESVEAVLELSRRRRPGARLVVTGCMAERYGDELAAAMPEVDVVAGFGQTLLPQPVAVGAPTLKRVPSFDLLELPRPAASRPWAYLKIAEGCDRRCAYCAIPTFRGPQRSRSVESILDELEALGSGVREVVLVAQDLASFGNDRTGSAPHSSNPRPVVELLKNVAKRVDRVRLLYLYPSSVDEHLIETICDTGVPYFDLSLQHVSERLLRRMRRPGGRTKFTQLINRIRSIAPEAAIRSNFILGFPGETEEDHDELLGFLDEGTLDWGGFFTFSEESGTAAVDLDAKIAPELALERLRECSLIQDSVTERRRQSLVGTQLSVLVDAPGIGRTHREAPEIDGIVNVPADLAVGRISDVVVTGSAGPDLWAEAVDCERAS